MEKNFRAKALGRTRPNCSQRIYKFFRRVVEFIDGARQCKPDPGT